MAYFYQKFIQQFGHFLAGNVLSLFLGLVTFPLLTRVLTKEEYGTLGLITTTMMLMVALGKAGLSDGVIRFYKKSVSNKHEEIVFNSTVFFQGISQSVVAVFIYVFGVLIVNEIWGMKNEQLSCFMIMTIALFVRPIIIVILNIMRVNGKTIYINIVGVVNRLLSVFMSLCLLIFYVKNVSGYFVGIVGADFVVAVVLLIWLVSNYKLQWSKISPRLGGDLVNFGWPLLMSELSYLLISYADRYMIAAYWGNNAVGEYSAGYNLANYISGVITFALSFAIIPTYVEIFTTEGREGTELFLEKSMGYLLILIIPICFGYYAIADDLFSILTSEKYVNAARFSPIILVGTFALGLNSVLYAGLYLHNKSIVILAITAGAVLVNIGLNVMFLPKFGVMGAALATLFTCILMNMTTALCSFRYITIRINYLLVVRYIVVSICMVFAIRYISTSGLFQLFCKVGVGLMMILCTILIFEKDISAEFFRWCRQRSFL